MANEKLKAWQKKNGVSDADIMLELGIVSANQYSNRMTGRTPWSFLERKSLVNLTGMTEEELFERG